MNIEQLKPNKRLTNRTALKIFIYRMLSVMKRRKHFYHYSSVSHSELINILPVFFLFFFLPQSKSFFFAYNTRGHQESMHMKAAASAKMLQLAKSCFSGSPFRHGCQQ